MDRKAFSLIILLLSVGFVAYCASTPDVASETIEEPQPPRVVATALADLFPTEGTETNGSAPSSRRTEESRLLLRSMRWRLANMVSISTKEIAANPMQVALGLT